MDKLDVKKVVFKEGPEDLSNGTAFHEEIPHPRGGVVDYGCRYPELRKQKSCLRRACGKVYNNYNGGQEREESHDPNIKVIEV